VSLERSLATEVLSPMPSIEASRLPSVIADVGLMTVTIGFHLSPDIVGNEDPHSMHCSNPSGFLVPHDEQ
jgi:hypothetical protein